MSVTTSRESDALLHMHQTSSVHSERAPQRARFLRPRRAFVPSTLPAGILALLVLLAWQIITAYGHINSLLLPTPADVLLSLREGLTSGIYLTSTLVTVRESTIGFLLALAIALPLGYGLVKSRLLSSALQPYLAAGQAIPAIVIAPFLSLLLGYGLVPNVIICALVVFFPMVMNTVLGLQTIDHSIIDAARVEGAARWSLLAYIEFPLALPAILTAIRTGFTLSITGALVGEFVGGGDPGLGSLVLLGKNQFNPPFMFATLVVLAVLAAIYYTGTWLLVKLAEALY